MGFLSTSNYTGNNLNYFYCFPSKIKIKWVSIIIEVFEYYNLEYGTMRVDFINIWEFCLINCLK